MKKLKSLRLNQLSKFELEQRAMSSIIGGYSCGCYYANSGGSSTDDNDAANKKYGYDSIPPSGGGGGNNGGNDGDPCGCLEYGNGYATKALYDAH